MERLPLAAHANEEEILLIIECMKHQW